MSVDLNNQEVQKAFYRWMKGNQNAIQLLNHFCLLAREVDDLVDTEDHSDNQARISTIIELSLMHIAGNPLFQSAHGPLTAVLIEMLVYWRISDEWKKGKDKKKHIFGYVWRESTDRLAVVLAGLIGGTNWAKTVAEEVYELTHAQSTETVQEWVADKSPEVKEDGTVRKHAQSA